MFTIWMIILVVAVLVVNPLIVKRLVKSEPNVWNGGFDILLDDSEVIPGSFENDYGLNGIDIPKGRLIKELVIKQVPKGFVPMIVTGREIKTKLVSYVYDFPENDRIVDLHFQVVNPEMLPNVFIFSVVSNQRIVHGEQLTNGGFFSPKRDIFIWYDRPGAKS